MTWTVKYTKGAEQDLDDIYDYYANERLDVVFASKLIGELANAANALDFMPFRYPAYPNEPWKSKGLRTLYKNNHVILYIPNKATSIVSIVRIMYGGRDIDKQLSIDN